MFQLSMWGPVLPWWQRESYRGRQRSWTDKLPSYCMVRDPFGFLCSPSHKGQWTSRSLQPPAHHRGLKEGEGSFAVVGHCFAAWGFALEKVERKHRATDLGSSHLQLCLIEGLTEGPGNWLCCQFQQEMVVCLSSSLHLSSRFFPWGVYVLRLIRLDNAVSPNSDTVMEDKMQTEGSKYNVSSRSYLRAGEMA